jgi:methionyl-tRNA formyltransferase
MKIIYMGTPEFAAAPLRALADAGHEIAVCVTQPDKPNSRRGNAVVYSPVKAEALARGIAVFQPEKISDGACEAYLKRLDAEIIVVCAYGQILKPNILNLTPYGCINIHASLLPKLRGAAPVNRCIMNGDTQSGVTVMYMDAGLDTGDMMIRESVPVPPDMTAGMLYERLSEAGSALIVKALALLEDGGAPREPQDGALATYAHKITKEECLVDFGESAENVRNKIRGLDPAPAAYAMLNGKKIKLFGAAPSDLSPFKVNGSILFENGGMVVSCKDGCVKIRRVKPEGKSEMDSASFANGLKNKDALSFER